MGKFLSQETMGAMRREEAIANSYVKRGLREDHKHWSMIYCGCGDPTCCFINDTAKYMTPKLPPAPPQPKKK